MKHVIIWKLREDISETEKNTILANAKNALEGLMGKIPGLLSIKVQIDMLPTSNGEMMLDTTFTDYEAMKAYSVNPLHVDVANTYVRPFTASRYCCDYED